MRTFQAFLASLILALPVQATSYTWDASGGAPLNDGAGNWNPTGGTNWFDGSTYGAWGNTTSDVAVFGVNSGAAGAVAVGAVTANGLTFNASGSGNYTLSGGTITLGGTSPAITANVDATIGGVISGVAGLTKEGNGTLTLTGGNDYAGGTIVSAGTLRLGNGTINPTVNSTYDIASGATLKLEYNTGGSAAQTWSKFTGAGTLALTSGKSFDTGWGSLSLPTAFTGTLRMERGRAFLLAATPNTYGLGGTTKVVVRPNGHFGMWENGTSLPASVAFEIEGTGYGETNYEAAVRMANSGGTSTINGPVLLTGNATIGAAGTGVLNGEISGGAALTVGTVGLNGTINLTNANSYTGATNIKSGTLLLSGGNNRLPVTTSLGFTGTSTLNLGGNDQAVTGFSFTGSLTGTITGGGSLQVTGATAVNVGYNSGVTATLRVIGTDVIFTPNLFVGRSESGAASSGTGTLLVQSGSFSAPTLYLARTIYTGGAFAPVASGTLTIDAGTVKIRTISIASSNKNNSPTAATINLNNGGVLYSERLQTSTAGSETITFNWNDGTLRNFNASSNLTIDANFNGGFKLLGAGLHAFDMDLGRTGTVNQGMSGVGTLTKQGDGALTLTAANSYTGATLVNAGTFNLTGGLTGGTAITVNNAAVFTQSVAGVISGAASFTHNSSATSTLAGVNTYSNPTAVDRGTLIVNGSLASTGLITVASGATLGGGGSVGHATLADGSRLAPGVADFTNNQITLSSLTLSEDSILLFDLDLPNPLANLTPSFYSDHVALNGALVLDGKLRVNPLAGFSPDPDSRWILMTYPAGAGNLTNDNGLVVDLANSPGLPAAPTGYSYVIDSSKDGYVFLSLAVPEPGVGALLGMGLLLLRRRFKRG